MTCPGPWTRSGRATSSTRPARETVLRAIIAFLESRDFEGRHSQRAISLGGDSDTLAAITGSIAEAAYGVP